MTRRFFIAIPRKPCLELYIHQDSATVFQKLGRKFHPLRKRLGRRRPVNAHYVENRYHTVHHQRANRNLEHDTAHAEMTHAALEFLDMHPVDLVLLDYKMPTMDGPAVLEAIRKDERLSNLPVIFLTANNDRQSVINAMQYKPDGYILKSKSPEEIKSTVVDFFKNREIRM